MGDDVMCQTAQLFRKYAVILTLTWLRDKIVVLQSRAPESEVETLVGKEKQHGFMELVW